MNRKRAGALRGRVSQGGCDASHANCARKDSTEEQEKKCAMKRGTGRGKMRRAEKEMKEKEEWDMREE